MIWILVAVGVAIIGLLLLRRYKRPSQVSGSASGDPAYDASSSFADVSTSSDASFAGGGGDFGVGGASGGWSDSVGSDGGASGGDGGGGGGD